MANIYDYNAGDELSALGSYLQGQGAPTGLAGMLGANRNALVGLGLGLMAGTRDQPFANALRGFTQGSENDALTSYRGFLMRKALADAAYQRQQNAQAQANWERSFARGDVTDFQKAAKDLGLAPGSPEYMAAAKQFYQPKTEGDWTIQDVGVDQWNRPVKQWINKRTMETRPIQPGGAQPTDAFAGGGGNVGYLGGGPMGTGTTPAVGPAVAGNTALGGAPKVTLPSGEVVNIPPGMDAKTFIQHITQSAADAATGKFPESQSKANIFANRMENAERTIQKTQSAAQGLEGLSGKLADMLPVGSDIFNTPAYQQYSRAKYDWITAQLRPESGAAINKDEYAKSERTFFPQPGDSDKTIADKAEARRIETEAIKRMAGPAYKSSTPPQTRETPQQPKAEQTKVIGGKTYFKRNGQWFEGS